MHCTSICDGDFIDILILDNMHRKMVRPIIYVVCLLYTRNQTLEKIDQAIKQASRTDRIKRSSSHFGDQDS